MTLLESITANPVFFNIPEKYAKAMFAARDFDPEEEYDEFSLKEAELISADLYMAMATVPEFKEGSLSVKYDSGMLRSLALGIYEKYEDPKADSGRWTKINPGITAVDYDA